MSTFPDDLDLPGHLPDPASGAPADQQWLEQVWAHPRARAALCIASPALAEQLGTLTSQGASRGRLRRLALTVASYLIRWQRRPSPFGLFAGVTPALAGDAASVRFGTAHRVVVSADAAWLSTLIDRLETHPGVLPLLPVTANSSGFTRGDRFVIPGQPSDGQPGPSLEVSIRHTRPVRLALTAAASPILFAQLAEQVAAAFPDTPADTITTMLTGLVKQGFLLTALRPPMTVVDGLTHVITHLRPAGDLPDIADLLTELAGIQHELARHSTAEPISLTVTERMASICRVSGPVLAADTAVEGRISLPHAVLGEAATAASTLLRLTSRPFGAEVWRDFHVAFRARYGPGALVPVRKLIGDSGLGFPSGFLGAPRGRTARALTERDHAVLALVQQATVDGRQEITLTESLIRELTVGNPEEMVVPQRVELAFHVHAPATEAVERGAFTLWVTGVPRPTSSMIGRFSHLLPPQDRDLLASSFAPPVGDAVVAQLSFPPRRRRNENVTRVPRLLPALISLSEHPDADAERIGVDDLAVTADARQMFLVQASTGRPVVPWVLHALEASVHTPPLARFLAGVASARHAVYGPFDFGAARRLPHLPRLRYGRCVLAPACWTLRAADLAGPGEAMREWEKRLDAWRDRWHVPSWVVVCEQEQRLPLDLGERLDRTLLRTRLERATRLELREHPEPDWLGHACEFVATLTTSPQARRPAPPALVQRPTTVLMPGAGDLVHARLRGHPARYDEILTGHLPRLLESLEPARWWFRRYRDTLTPGSLQELWLYVQLTDPGRYGTAAAHLADFAAGLHAQGLLAYLSLAPYQPQTGRYGPGAMLAAAHEVAAADSAAALAQITMAARTGLPGQAITAASMAELATGLAASDEGYRWLVSRLDRTYGKLDRALRDVTLLLADPANGHRSLRERPGGAAVADTWAARRATLNSYRRQLIRHHCQPITVLRSLLHDHHVRGLGVDPDTEAVTNRLARAAALRLLAVNVEAGR